MPVRLPSNEQILYVANILANKLLFRQKVVDAPKTILVVKWDEIGDMATCTHVFASLKLSYPDSELTVLCKPFVKNLVINDPHIDKVLTDGSEYHRVYNLVVELRGTWKTLFKAIRYKAKYRVSRAETRLKHKGRQLHEIHTNMEIVRPLLLEGVTGSMPVLYYNEKDAARVSEFLENNHIGRFALIHAGARRKLRQWNLDRFALAAQYLHEKYGLEIIFVGSGEDKKDIESINSYLDFKTFDFSSGFSLSEFGSLCSRASFYLGNESGPMHIASAFKVPMIGLFGPGVPNVFYPLSEKSVVLHHVLSCNPCDQIHCVHPENPCISRIMAGDVFEKIDEILHK